MVSVQGSQDCKAAVMRRNLLNPGNPGGVPILFTRMGGKKPVLKKRVRAAQRLKKFNLA